MFGIVEKLKKSREETALTDRAKYLSLVRKAAAGFDLSNAERSELDQLAESLGRKLERIDADISLIAEYGRAKKSADDLAPLSSKLKVAGDKADAFRTETVTLTEARKAKQVDLDWEVDAAVAAIERARTANGRLTEIEEGNHELLGITLPVRTKPVANLLMRREVISFAHQKERRNLRIGSDELAKAIKFESEELDGHDAMKAKAGPNLFEFSLNDLDPAQTNIGIDPDDYDFQPIPGQPKPEFDELLATVRAARDGKLRREGTISL